MSVTPASPLWGDHHGHPGCFGCQMCLACVVRDEPCPGCASLAAARALHSPPFLAAFDALTPHLCAPVRVVRLTLPASVATWERDGVTWELDDCTDATVMTAIVGDRKCSRVIAPPVHTAEDAVRVCRERIAADRATVVPT